MRITLTLSLVLFMARSIPAQDIAGKLEGRVVSADGIAVADVVITVTGPSLQRERIVTSDQRGRFLITGLPVGTYRVRFRRVGYRPTTVEEIPVRLGGTTSLPELKLEAAAVGLEELVVTGATIGLDPASTASGITLDARRLSGLPLDRNFREIVLLAPGATPSFYGTNIDRDGVNVAGATGYENNFFVDGIDVTSPIRGESSIDLPYNFLEAIQVRIGGSAADNAGALGGVVNVVTPNGSNRLKGQVFGFYSNDAMQTESRSVIGFYQTGFTFYDVGGSLSGPLVRDRLWFFAAYNPNYEQRENTYGFGTIADTRRQHLFAGKLTWQAGPRTSTSFTVLGDPSRRERIGYGPLVFSPGVPLNPEVIQLQNDISSLGLSLRAQHSFTPGTMVELTAAQTTRLETYHPLTAGYGPPLSDAVNGTLSGGFGDDERYDGSRRSVRADLSWQPRAHSLKAGVEYELLAATLDVDLSRTGAGGTLTRQDTATYTWHSALGLGGRTRHQNPSFYVQDSWQVSSRLLFNFGVRWSQQSFYDVNGDSLHFQVRDGLQPRVGVVYQPARDGSHRFYASYARIADQIVTWHAQEYGVGAESLMVFPRDPRVDTTGMTLIYGIPTAPASVDQEHLKGMVSDEFALGYDRRLAAGTTISLRGLRRVLRDALQIGSDTLGRFPVWGNPGRGALANFPRPKRTYTALEVTLDHTSRSGSWIRGSYILSRTSGNYPGLYMTDWENGVPHYGPQYASPEQHTNGEGLLPNDRTHVFKVIGAYLGINNLSLGASGLLASGTPLSEFGAIDFPPPFRGFVTQRGTAGRTPTIWDLNLRAEYLVGFISSERTKTRFVLDVQHVGSPRRAVRYDQFHYTCLDGGDQSCPNARYGEPTHYQVPMTARLGVLLDF